MRHRLEIQSPVAATSTVGAAKFSYAPVATVWADIRPLSGREMLLAGQAQSRRTHEITMRYYEGLTSKHLLIERRRGATRTFEIEHVLDVNERHVQHLVLAVEAA